LTVKSISEKLPYVVDLRKLSPASLTALECRRRNLEDLLLDMSGRHLDE